MSFSSTRPLVFAHRGGCLLGPENTIPAFERGLAAGADGVELDVRLSRDGVPMVIHDPTLERTTDAEGPVAERTAAQLAKVDAAHRFQREGHFPQRDRGIRVPTLAEVLSRFSRTRVIIELKDDTAELGAAVATVIQAARAEDRVCTAGVGARAARTVRAMLPRVATSACLSEVRMALYRSWFGVSVARSARYRGFQVPERSGRHRIVSPSFIKAAHAAGAFVQVWTVDNRDDCLRLLGWGVDGLITDNLDVAISARDAFVSGGRRVVSATLEPPGARRPSSRA